jgi:hypothetical protein
MPKPQTNDESNESTTTTTAYRVCQQQALRVVASVTPALSSDLAAIGAFVAAECLPGCDQFGSGVGQRVDVAVGQFPTAAGTDRLCLVRGVSKPYCDKA